MKVSTQLMLVVLLASTFPANAPAAPQAKTPARTAAKKTAPAAASPGAAASTGSSAAFNTYANQLRQKMGTTWIYPNGKNHVTLTIQVAQDGSVSDLTLASSPKNTEAEQKANDAFNTAQPLQALPTGVTQATITAVFDSQADQWDSKANISVKIDPTKTAAPASDAKSGEAESPKKEEQAADKKDEKEDKK